MVPKANLSDLTGTGTVRVQVFTARAALPVQSAAVTLTLPDGTSISSQVDEGGNAGPFSVPCPPKSLSLEENNTILPYSTCSILVEAPGYDPAETIGVQVFDTVESLMQFPLLPKEDPDAGAPARTASIMSEVSNVPVHKLFTGGQSSAVAPVQACQSQARVLTQPVIPEKITVHLGAPSANVQNVTVSFRDYIKNVASSEVYPTWPEESLRANIHAQISLAINRIYTEWYKSKGYSFQITGSPGYDQAYVHGRNIFEPMSRITDEIFNTYARKKGTVNPYFTEYCDGKTVTCKGMKQWGTKDLAEQGKNALQILRYYYGDDLELVRTDNIAAIPSSYPGTPLKKGDSGESVRIIQRQLNRIAQDYPFFGRTNTDGIFGQDTEDVVKKFQKQFNLTADGIVGRSTWYKISYIYVSVKDLAELTSEGEKPDGNLVAGVYPGTALRLGDRGDAVEQVQFWLSEVSEYNSKIPSPAVDGIFGTGTQAAVKAFQEQYGLTVDGVVGKATWNRLYAEYISIEDDLSTPDGDGSGAGAYPGTPLKNGSRGNAVRRIQAWLRIISNSTPEIPTITVDGIFGSATERAVRAFQSHYGLTVDGIIGRATWNKIYEVYTSIINGLLEPGERPGTYPGSPLRVGSRGKAVKEVQYYLYLLSAYYPEIPVIAFDGVFGRATQEAVLAYQRLFSLTQDGIVGKATWDSIYAQFSKLRSVDGPLISFRVFAYPGYVLSEGQSGQMVQFVQFMLAYIAFFWDTVLPIDELNGNYDAQTTEVIRSFQRDFGLTVTGNVDEITWNALVITYLTFASVGLDGERPVGEYPGYTMTLGSAGAPVLEMQGFMNDIASRYCAAWFVPESGIIDETTFNAIKEFQMGFGLPVTGLVDRATWDAIYAYYLSGE